MVYGRLLRVQVNAVVQTIKLNVDVCRQRNSMTYHGQHKFCNYKHLHLKFQLKKSSFLFWVLNVPNHPKNQPFCKPFDQPSFNFNLLFSCGFYLLELECCTIPICIVSMRIRSLRWYQMRWQVDYNDCKYSSIKSLKKDFVSYQFQTI